MDLVKKIHDEIYLKNINNNNNNNNNNNSFKAINMNTDIINNHKAQTSYANVNETVNGSLINYEKELD